MTVDRDVLGSRIRRAARGGGAPLGAGAIAGLIALGLILFAPPGGDQAAHLYLTQAWRDHGWQLWDNLWYSGRYAQVNYSLLFYPLAALLHPISVVAASCGAAAVGFAALLHRRWPAIATGPALAFAFLVPLAVVAGTYPFLLGLAIAIWTLVALERGRRGPILVGIVVTALAHPLALAFLLVVLGAIAVSTRGWWRSRGNLTVAVGAVAVAGAQGLLLRGFSTDGGTYPFDRKDALAIAGFCVAGLLLTRGLADQRPLRAVFLGYAALGAVAFTLSSPLGGNAVRLMLLMGVPLLLLPLAARGFRPRGVAVACLLVVFMWQTLPAVAGWRTSTESRAQDETFWYPVIAFLEGHREPDQRVQVVATADNWEAYHLARRGVPLARGWFRQDDFPANAVLYGELTPVSYDRWLRRTGVHYVFLPDDPLDYSASNEAALLRSGESGLRQVQRVGGWTVFELPRPTPIATPAAGISVVSLTSNDVTLRVERPGTYRLRLRYTPYWRVELGAACATPREPWGTDLRVSEPGTVRLSFDVRLGTFVGAVLGSEGGCGSPVLGPPAPGEKR
jgi:hypothetical protein